MSKKIELKNIKKADYNPRMMGADAKKALRSSILEFQNISGIVINKKTGNIFAGNHRWEQLCGVYGESNIVFSELGGEYYQILSGDTDTGFLARIVDWTKSKEKAANIAANSNLLQGEFTSGLQEILLELSTEVDVLFEDLRFDELSIDLGDLSAIGRGITDPSAATDKIRGSSESKNIMLDDSGNQAGDVRHIAGTVKILIHGDNFDMIREEIIDFLSNRPYYDDVTIS